MIEHPDDLSAGTPRMAALAELTSLVTRTPWALSRTHLARAHSAGLSDADVVHAVALSAYFGHLNRVADAVGVPLDYEVSFSVPPVDRAAAVFDTAPLARAGRPAIDTAIRPETARTLSEWKTYAFYRDAPLPRRQRTYLARCVAQWLGDAGISRPHDMTHNPLDEPLQTLAEIVTLAPWQLTAQSYEALRKSGFDDATLFDVVATTSAAGVFSRIEVALVALGT